MRVPLPGRDYFPPRVLLRSGRPSLEVFRAAEAGAQGAASGAGQAEGCSASVVPPALPLQDMRTAVA